MKKLIFILAAGLFLVGCSKDNGMSTNPTYNPTAYFAMGLDFYSDRWSADNEINVSFLFSDLSVIPSVVVNGYQLNEIEINEEGIEMEGEIPYSTVINYSVSANGKSTSGTINMPYITNATCSGQLLRTDTTNAVTLADSYAFSWTGSNFMGGFNIYSEFYMVDSGYYYYRYIDTSILQSTITLFRQNDTLQRFSIEGVNGVNLIPGATPNVTGLYGNGYVVAKCHYEYDIGRQ